MEKLNFSSLNYEQAQSSDNAESKNIEKTEKFMTALTVIFMVKAA